MSFEVDVRNSASRFAALVVVAGCSGGASSPGPDGGVDGSQPLDAGDAAPADAASSDGGGDVIAGDAGAAPTCTGGFTLDVQQPTTCVPYAANPLCLTCKQLPGAGQGGPLAHLFPGSDAAASALVTNAAGGLSRFHGDGSGASAPFYYATASDPWYHLAPGTCYYDKKLDIRFHAPTGAPFAASGGGDDNFAVWDQAQGLIVEMYVSIAMGATHALPPATGCGGTAATACELPMNFGGGCGVERPFSGVGATDQDWGPISEPFAGGQTIGGSSNDLAAWAATIRIEELQLGQIAHALSAGYGCANPNVGNGGRVFPAQGTNYLSASCSPGVATGALVFTDYTDADIAAMGVPSWQKTILTALSHYGTYLLDTSGATTNEVTPVGYNYGAEGLEAWRFARPSCNATCATAGKACDDCVDGPFFQWLDAQSGVVGGEDILPWNGVPVVGGKGIEGHVHIADPCVAAGMAGAKTGQGGAPAACVASLWVELAGPGSDATGAGTVTASCDGGTCAALSCVGRYCDLSADIGTAVTLAASPAAAHSFAGWSGACTGSGACTATLGTPGVTTVTAKFD
jgi:hypothetical protein